MYVADLIIEIFSTDLTMLVLLERPQGNGSKLWKILVTPNCLLIISGRDWMLEVNFLDTAAIQEFS